MARINAPLLAFNRGLISELSLARHDLDRVRLSASLMTNWMPKSQGAMRLRPGTKHLGSSVNDTGAAWIDFVAATDDTALLEFTPLAMRVWIDDALLTRPTRLTTITDFNADTGQWTSGSTNGGTIGFGDTGLVLDAVNRGGLAQASRKVNLGGLSDTGEELGLKIHVSRGPVTFRCGKNDTGDDSYITETALRTGHHNLAFTPDDTGGFHLLFRSAQDVKRIVASCTMADTGVVSVTTPWAATDLDNIRHDQSADVVFVACKGKKQHRIERRGTGTSWSVVEYQSDNGPFTAGKTAADVKLKVAQTFGNTTLTADRPFFKTTHAGALFYLFHFGYHWTFKLSGEDVYTDPITVTGISVASGTPDDRDYHYKVTTGFTGTLSLLHSTEDKIAGPYVATNVEGGQAAKTITDTGTFSKANGSENEVNNNLTEYVKVGFQPGDHTSGVATVIFEEDASTVEGYKGGGDYGIVRVTEYVSPTVVNCEVLRSPTRTDYTTDWREGQWSDAQKWPTDVTLYEGRLWWHGQAYTWGSTSDDYENYDDQQEGDASPIIRVLGSGPVDTITFSAALSRLLLGTAGSVLSLRSGNFDEPLTRDNMTAKPSTTQGAAPLRAVRIDSRAIYIHRSRTRLYELIYDVDAYDYVGRELTVHVPDVLGAQVVDIAVQRQPDTRIHCVLADGNVAILTYEPIENLLCWSTWETDGTVERAVVLPGITEDAVYYHINRTINGVTKRFLEKWAMESECLGDTGLSWLADCAKSYTDGTRTSTLTGYSHLEGESVIVWADDTGQTDAGKDLSPDDTGGTVQTTYTVTSGNITLGESVHHAVAGLPYSADWRSVKLAYDAEAGTSLAQMKRTDHIAFLLYQTHNNGLYYGRDTGDLDPLPRMSDEGAQVDSDKIYKTFDQVSMPFPGLWDEDSRIYLKAKAPRPATVMAAIPTVVTNEKIGRPARPRQQRPAPHQQYAQTRKPIEDEQ